LHEAPWMRAGVPSDGEGATDRVAYHQGDSLEFLRTLPSGIAGLVVTSPPYNLGKSYETRDSLERYLEGQEPVIAELVRLLHLRGSLCWQVGNWVADGEVYPLDMYYYPLFKRHGLRLRNRIVWHFGHGLHTRTRFSGRYETLLWFTRSDEYVFHLDPVRVPSKYPGKRAYKGARAGQPSGNPLGKNPSDVWEIVARDWESGLWDIPNVKAMHPEKTPHPCQVPVELVERCVLALTDPDDLVLDPYAGVGSSLIAALLHGRRAIGVEREAEYVAIGLERLRALAEGTLRLRPMTRPVHQPSGRERVAQRPPEWGPV
jgi:adenine-specific DNA-methyltransferase